MAQKKKPLFHSQHNYKDHPSHYEHPEGESQTIPGEARTIRELFEQYTSGVELPQQHEEFYHLNPTFETDTTHRNPDFDLTDLEDIVDRQIQTEAKAEETKRAKLDKDFDDQKSEDSSDKPKEFTDEDISEKTSDDES